MNETMLQKASEWILARGQGGQALTFNSYLDISVMKGSLGEEDHVEC